jgi:DnaJ-class molecular chaperone
MQNCWLTAGTQHGAILAMRNKGVQKGSTKGTQYVHVKLALPKHLSTQQRTLLEQLRQAEVAAGLPPAMLAAEKTKLDAQRRVQEFKAKHAKASS